LGPTASVTSSPAVTTATFSDFQAPIVAVASTPDFPAYSFCTSAASGASAPCTTTSGVAADGDAVALGALDVAAGSAAAVHAASTPTAQAMATTLFRVRMPDTVCRWLANRWRRV